MLVLLVLLAGGLLRPSATRLAYAGGDRHSRHSDEVIVQISPSSGTTVDDINASHGTSTVEAVAPEAGVYLLRTESGEDAEFETEELDNDQRVAYAEPNLVGQIPEISGSNIKGWGGFDPAPLATQYAAAELGLEQAQGFSRGQGIVVAIIDTGVQLDHPALAGSLTETRYDFLNATTTPDDTGNGIDDDGNGLVDEGVGHGTHIAGIVHQVAPEAKIMPLRALDSDGSGDLVTLIRAIDFAVNNGADVINLSLGMPMRSRLLSSAIRSATRHGVIVVAAAGNLSSSFAQYPAADSCVISVTSTGPTDTRSDFANYGGWIDFTAPGESIYSMYPRDGYAWWSGTSMAAPFVAGQAALLRSLSPRLDARATAGVIAATAQPLDQLNPAFVGKLGDGRINIGASVAAVAQGQYNNDLSSRIAETCVDS
jgi:subtilisin family serine protease